MALNWNIKKVENYNELLDNNNCLKYPYTNIVLATMQVGFDEITQKNWEEFYKRINFIERVYGESDYIKKDDVKRLIGLETNATRKSPTQFLNQFINKIK